jgi:hypothetical protein
MRLNLVEPRDGAARTPHDERPQPTRSGASWAHGIRDLLSKPLAMETPIARLAYWLHRRSTLCVECRQQPRRDGRFCSDERSAEAGYWQAIAWATSIA